MKKIILLILILIAYFILFKGDCGCDENMTNLDEGTDLAKLDELYPEPPEVKNGRVNINDLPECKLPMKVDYNANLNNMVNNGKQITQDMVKPEEHKAMIGENRHNLKQISWSKSNLNWHEEEIPLEIRLTHVDQDTYKLTHIIFPVKLVDQKIKEGFIGDSLGSIGNSIGSIGNTLGNSFSSFFGLDLGMLPNDVTKVLTDINNNQQITNTISKAVSIIVQTPEIKKLVENTNIQKLVNSDELNKIVNAVKSTGITDQSKLAELIKNNIDSKVREKAQQAVSNLVKDFPTLKDIPNLDKPEVVVKVQEIKEKLQSVNLDKLDVNQVLTKKDSVDLDKLNKKLESMNFNEIAQNFDNQKFSLYDINSLLNLNTLITDKSAIPTYECCSPNYGKVTNVDLCKTASKVLDQEKFFFTNGNDGSLVLITKPQPYEKAVGLKMLDNLEEPHKLF